MHSPFATAVEIAGEWVGVGKGVADGAGIVVGEGVEDGVSVDVGVAVLVDVVADTGPGCPEVASPVIVASAAQDTERNATPTAANLAN